MQNAEVLSELRLAHFDVAFTHHYDLCAVGLARVLAIPATIWTATCPLPEYMAAISGLPAAPSYVPNLMSSYGDVMTPLQRILNFAGIAIVQAVWDYTIIRVPACPLRLLKERAPLATQT